MTDPDQETVYFGNNPSRGGGRLLADVRCRARTPRAEIVRFTAPKPGRYRVGVEYHRSCFFRREAISFRIDIRSDSVGRTHSGEITPGRFESKVLEFMFEAPPS
ncbi:MAG: hypothetical protein GY910_28245 [bacterium]|nr:hypothetical protein [bacterium]